MPTITEPGSLFYGTDEAETIDVRATDATAYGMGGNDWLTAALENIAPGGEFGLVSADLRGDDGFDTIEIGGVSSGDYTVGRAEGGKGDDMILMDITAGEGRAYAHAGSGDDYMVVEYYSDDDVRIETIGASGADVIEVIASGDWVRATLSGSSGADWLSATIDAETADVRLSGGRGEDTLHGSEAGDVLNGGLGRDLVWGHGGADVFEFNAARGWSSKDTLQDYDHSEGDVIDLGLIDANIWQDGDQGFTFSGADDWHGTGRVWASEATSTDATVIRADTGHRIAIVVIDDGATTADSYGADDFLL